MEALKTQLQVKEQECQRAKLMLEAFKQEYLHLLAAGTGQSAAPLTRNAPWLTPGSLKQHKASPLRSALLSRQRRPATAQGSTAAKLAKRRTAAGTARTCSPARQRLASAYRNSVAAGHSRPAKAAQLLVPAGAAASAEALRRQNSWLEHQLYASDACLVQLQRELCAAQGPRAAQLTSPERKAHARRRPAVCEATTSTAAPVETAHSCHEAGSKPAPTELTAEAQEYEDIAAADSQAVESGSGMVGVLQTALEEERRKRREVQRKLDALAAVQDDNLRLRERFAEAEQEATHAHERCSMHREQMEIMRSQLGELEHILAEKHADIGALHDEVGRLRLRVAEAECATADTRPASVEGAGKLVKLEQATEQLLQEMAAEHQRLAAANRDLTATVTALRHELAAERQAVAMLTAQKQVAEQQGKSAEASLLSQLQATQEERNACLAAATRADALLARLTLDRLASPPRTQPGARAASSGTAGAR